MTGTEVLEALAIGSIAGTASSAAVLFGTIAGRAFAARYRWVGFWPERRQPPPTPDAGPVLPAFDLPPINLRCPHCGEEYTIQISGGAEVPDPSGMPLGERLQAERRELMRRLEAAKKGLPGSAGLETRERYEQRIAAIDRELRRFN
jgi:hypothetical protein